MTNEQKTADIIAKLSSEAALKTPPFPLKKAFAGLLVFSFVYIAFVLHFFYGLRPDFMDKILMTSFLVELAAVFALIAVTYSLTVYYAPPRKAFKKQQFIFVALIIAVICALVCTFSEESMTAFDLNLIHSSCFASIIVFALPTAVIGFIILKKSATTNPEWLGFTTLLLAGTMGYLGVRLTCAMETMHHQICTHLLPVVLFTALGYFMGRKILSW
ncbi:MAG: hypothetical protein ACI9TY_000371 [Alphaproteobacteria bacterium]|jgi:hypothetical protein